MTVPAVHTSHLFVRLADNGVAVDLTLSSDVDGTAEVDIAGLAKGKIEVRAGAGTAVMDCAPELWSPDSLRLYDVTVTYGSDRVTDRVGFRRI